MDKYCCDVCSYVYDPERGDIVGSIDKGTSFEDLPEGWKCPVCGAICEEFTKD